MSVRERCRSDVGVQLVMALTVIVC